MYRIKTDHPLTGFMDTRIGGREENQDSCGFSDTPLGALAVVCDGMGGLRGGATASSVAVSAVIESVNAAEKSDDPVAAIKNAVNAANNAVIAKGLECPELSGMGTTLTLILISSECAYVTHVGDSRVYQLRSGRKVFRTMDDSVVFQLVRLGSITEEQARLAPNSNIITKALGIGEALDFDVERLPYDKGDRFILCTDGFWGNMPENDFLEIVGKTGDLELVMERSFNKVEKAGFQSKEGRHDNLTAAIIDVETYSTYRSKMEKTFKITSVALAALLLMSFVGNVFLIRSNKDSRQDNENLMQQAESARSVADSLGNVAVSLGDIAASMEENALKMQAQTDSINRELKKAEESAKKNGNDSKTAKAARDKADSLRTVAEQKRKAAEQAAVEARNAESAAKDAKEKAENAKSRAEALNRNLKDENAGLQKQNQSLESDIASLKDQITKLKEELLQKEADLKRINTDLQRETEARKAAQDSLKKYNAKMAKPATEAGAATTAETETK